MVQSGTTGFRRSTVSRIAAATRNWPGGWTVDLAGDVLAPAVILIPEAMDEFAPAFHVEQAEGSVVVVCVRDDDPVPVGTFADVDAALSHLGDLVRSESWRSGRLA